LTSGICKTDHVGVTTMERLDQGHLQLMLEVPRLKCLGWESIPGLHSRRRAMSYSNSVLIAILNILI
jgi:hypothetical protein